MNYYWRILKSRTFQFVVFVVVAGLAMYSVYVTRHKPDSQETVLLGQNELFSDSFASFCILVRDYRKSLPISGADIQLSIEGQGISRELGNFVTNSSGSLSEAVYIPEISCGKYKLIVDSQSEAGKDHIVSSIEIKRAYAVFLTTDKPVYQPGQTIHMRALVLNRLSQKPYAEQPILFEIIDSKGNKVYKKNLKSSEYGIVSCDFELADEVNLGQYEIHTIIDDVKSQKTVTVERYVLPMFKIELTSNKPFYLPSEKISCSIKADYFFGKPVANAQVAVTGRISFEKPTDVFKVTGTTDSTGRFGFEYELAKYFAGKALPATNSLLEMEVKVTDRAGHEEISVKKITLAWQSINIHIFPEGSNFLSSFENVFYIMTAYPNGQPALCDVEINGTTYKSDENGITVFKTNINNTQSIPFNIKAQDQAGLTGTFTDKMRFWHRGENLILRTDKAVYEAGEKLNVNILSSMGGVTYFVDIIKNGQTMMYKILPAYNGKAELEIDLSDDLCGTLKINAYAFTSNDDAYHYRSGMRATMDSRVVHVRRVNRLQVDTSLDKAIYQPGETARLNLIITDSNGIPTPAALSLVSVDEAVFYACGNHPGKMEQFFIADKELLGPVYQIAFAFSPEKVLSGEDRYQNLARVLFSSEAQDINWQSLFLIPNSEEDSESQSITHYPKFMQEDYAIQVETQSDKQRQLTAFRHRYINIPLAFLLILCALAVPLGLFGFFAHSIFRLFRKLSLQEFSSTKKQTYSIENRRIYFFVFFILFPMVTYLILVLVGVMRDSYYLDGYLDLGLPFLVVVTITLATVTFPFLCSLGTTSIHKKRKTIIRCFALSLFCIGLVFIIMSSTAIAITEIIFTDKTALLFSIVLFLLSLAFYLIAGMTSRKPPGRFFSELGRSGHIVLVTGLAQTLIILMFVVMFPIEDVAKTFKKTFRTPYKRVIISSDRNFVAFYGGMGGFGGGMMGGFGGGMMGGVGEYEQIEAPPRIREYFPETLFWQPELITDEKGHSIIEVPLADSITNWKMNIDAVSAAGKLGSSEVNIPVFQDFFVDVDLPVALTRNDEVSIAVVCYNYLQQSQTIQLALQASPWFEALESVTKTIELPPNDAKSVRFYIKAQQVGTHELTVFAKGVNLSDAIKRSIDVKPDGVEIVDLQNGLLKNSVEHSFNIPAETITNSQNLLLKFYPSRFSKVVEGLDTIFRMPYGCFEQSTSVTYPNVMALLYMKSTGQVTPETEAKARKFITVGYQRLLTFEISGGGFDWFGEPPAKEKLTAYGIMQLSDISKVQEIDQAAIQRANKWLMSRQKDDGSWDGSGPRESRIKNKTATDNTTYIAWALAEANIRGPMLDKALAFLRQNLNDTDSPYTIALAANTLLASNLNDPVGRQLVSKLTSKFQLQGNSMYIPSSGIGAMHSRGSYLDIETTALSALAIMKVNPYADTARKALSWLFEQKDIRGTWGSTQATIMAMKALITGTDEPGGNNVKSNRIDIIVNNQPAGSIEIKADMRDLLYTKNLTSYLQQGENNIHITQNQAMELPYRLGGTYWVPEKSTLISSEKDLEINVVCDKYNLAVDDVLTCNVQVTNRGDVPSGMVIIDLGVPPGFKVDASTFERLVKSGTLAKYEVNTNRYILYIRSIIPNRPLNFIYEMKALYPIRAHVPPSKVYEYYQPNNIDQTEPIIVVITE